jgi:predicted acetyltransferase
MRFRRATEQDLDRLIEIHTSAFPDPRPYDARARNFTRNILGALDDLRVADDAGIVAHAFLFPLEASFGGKKVKAGGIASVGVAPEARGRGVAAALLAHLHDESRARGDAIDVLYPFRQAFYARHGYGTTSPMRHLVFAPSAVPHAWSKARVRRMEVRDQAAVANVYERSASRGTGSLARSAMFWAARLLDERRVWLVVESSSGDVAGYLSWSVEQAESHAKTTMTVHELVANDDVARRALFGAIGAQRDQVVEVRVAVDAGDPVERALVDADRGISGTAEIEHAVGTLASGPMVRIVDLERAVAARGYATDGAASLVIDGRPPVGAQIENGAGRLVPTGTGPTLTTDSATLAAVLYGALAPSDAARLGLAVVTGGTDALDRLFRLPPYFALDPF